MFPGQIIDKSELELWSRSKVGWYSIPQRQILSFCHAHFNPFMPTVPKRDIGKQCGPGSWFTDHSKAVVRVLVLLFVALWFILRGDLFYVLPCVILFLCFSVLLALRLPRLGKRELILVLFVCLFDLHFVWFYLFPFPLGVWQGLRFVIVALPGLFSYL